MSLLDLEHPNLAPNAMEEPSWLELKPPAGSLQTPSRLEGKGVKISSGTIFLEKFWGENMSNEDENRDSEEQMWVFVHDIRVLRTLLCLLIPDKPPVSALPNWTSLFSHFTWEFDTQLEGSPPSDIRRILAF